MTHSTSNMRIVAIILVAYILIPSSLLYAQKSLPSLQEVAFTAFQSGDYTTAYEHLSAMMTPQNRDEIPARAYLFKALIERQNKAYDRSISTFERGLAHHPEHRDLMMELAVTYSWSQRVEEALSIYERILTHTPSDLAAQQGRARMLSWLGRHDEALALYTRMLDLPEARQQALLGAAFVYRAQGRRRLARQYYEMILEEDDSHIEALDGLKAVEAMKVGRVSYRIDAGRTRSGESNVEMRAGLVLQPRSRWMCAIDYVRRTSALALSMTTPRQSLHQLELGASRSLGDTYTLGLRLGYQFDAGTAVVGAEGSAKLLDTLVLSYGLRHQSATAHVPGVQVYRLGVTRVLTPRQELSVQGFASTFEVSQPESIALSTRHQIGWFDGRVLLVNSLTPEFSRTDRVGLSGESALRLSTHVWGIEVGARAGFRRERFAGLHTALTRSF